MCSADERSAGRAAAAGPRLPPAGSTVRPADVSTICSPGGRPEWRRWPPGSAGRLALSPCCHGLPLVAPRSVVTSVSGLRLCRCTSRLQHNTAPQLVTRSASQTAGWQHNAAPQLVTRPASQTAGWQHNAARQLVTRSASQTDGWCDNKQNR